MTKDFRIKPCTTVQEFADQFNPPDTVRWVQSVGNSLYLRAAGGRKLTEVVIALVWVGHFDVFPGWYCCDINKGWTEGMHVLIPWARKNAIGAMGIIVPGTTSDHGSVKASWIRDFIWFENEADAVDFELNFENFETRRK